MPSQSSLLGGWQAFGHMADHRLERGILAACRVPHSAVFRVRFLARA
jgi:hypothetical protein